MTNAMWEQQRKFAIAAAFQTGRPVFADSEGELRYADFNSEAELPVPELSKSPTWWTRAIRWLLTFSRLR
jgi:hypothetical protein